VPTKITDSNHGDSLQGSPEKRVDISPDGTLWALIVTQGGPGQAKFFRSTNGGSTWSYVASDISLEQSSAVPSFYIDQDGYAHVSWIKWNSNPQVIRYARGTPITGGGGWVWTYLTISPASGRTGVDSDIVAFRSGSGWQVWISYGLGSTGGEKVAQVNVTASGTLSVTATQHGPPTGAVNFQFGSLEFNHTGDGKTPAASPHIFLVTAIQGAASLLRANRAVYSAGNWTWDAPVTIDASAQIDRTTMTTAWDGSRLMIAWSEGTSTVLVSEWDGAATVTARNPPAAPGGTGAVAGLSLSVDPVTDDVYLAYYDVTDGDIRWSKFTRGTTTWSAWAVAITRTASADDGKVQLVKHPTRDSVDMVYATGSGVSWQVFSHQLAALVRSPDAPTLTFPASGANLDLAAGVTFRWLYNPVSPGDTQQAWAFRRVYGATTEYWNATAQTWGGSITWNTSVPADPSAAPFAAGKWSNGTTYTWSARTRSSTGADSAWAADRTVVATSAPVVDVVSPLGLVYGETTPLVEWTYTGLDAQASYEVRILVEDAAIDNTNPVLGQVWTSGVVNSSIARQHRVALSLSNGVAYRAYVRSTSVTAVASPWDYSPFTISVTPPSGPLVEVSDAISYETDVPFVRLDLTAQSSFLTLEQDAGTSGWVNDTNTTVAVQPLDSVLQIFPGVKMTSIGAGLMGMVTDVGTPPEAPFGEPALSGPLSFPVVAGVAYTGLCGMRSDSLTRAARIRIRWYDADDGTGSLISESVGDQVVIASVGYGLAILSAVAPVGAVLARMVIEVLGAVGAGEIFYMAFPAFTPGRATGWSPGGYSQTQTLKVQRSVDDGVTWVTIIERLKPNYAQRAVGTDRLMPYGIDVKYRAFTEVDPGAGAILSSGSSLIATLLVPSETWGIRDPADELGEFNAWVVGHRRGDDESSSVHYPSGREFPVVDTEGIHGAKGTLSIYVFAGDIDRVTGVLRRVVPMVVQSPAGAVHTVRMIRREYNIAQSRHRIIEVPYVEIANV
jgi:hypothetical protein